MNMIGRANSEANAIIIIGLALVELWDVNWGIEFIDRSELNIMFK